MEAISAYFLREKGCVERAHCIKLELMRELVAEWQSLIETRIDEKDNALTVEENRDCSLPLETWQ